MLVGSNHDALGNCSGHYAHPLFKGPLCNNKMELEYIRPSFGAVRTFTLGPIHIPAVPRNSLFNMATDKKGRAFDPVAKKKAKQATRRAWPSRMDYKNQHGLVPRLSKTALDWFSNGGLPTGSCQTLRSGSFFWPGPAQ